MGDIAKTGSRPTDALCPAETPVEQGLNFMDTSSAATEPVVLTKLYPSG